MPCPYPPLGDDGGHEITSVAILDALVPASAGVDLDKIAWAIGSAEPDDSAEQVLLPEFLRQLERAAELCVCVAPLDRSIAPFDIAQVA
jgi:hypothetical protein